jgi:hypothetical protein
MSGEKMNENGANGYSIEVPEKVEQGENYCFIPRHCSNNKKIWK